MEINIFTSNAELLKKKIFNSVGDPLNTWDARKSKSGKELLTPTANQYVDLVILRLTANKDNNKLTVYPTCWSKIEEPSNAVKAIVIGMFTAALLTHFGNDFSKLEIL